MYIKQYPNLISIRGTVYNIPLYSTLFLSIPTPTRNLRHGVCLYLLIHLMQTNFLETKSFDGFVYTTNYLNKFG